MSKARHSAFSRIRYLVDPAQPSQFVIPLGVAVEVVIREQWMIGLCARTALLPEETALLDGVGRELLLNPFEAIKAEIPSLIRTITKPGDALDFLASSHTWSLNVTPAEKWAESFQPPPLEAQIREKMVALWKKLLGELATPPSLDEGKRQRSRPTHRRPPASAFSLPAGRSFVQDDCWRGVVPAKAA